MSYKNKINLLDKLSEHTKKYTLKNVFVNQNMSSIIELLSNININMENENYFLYTFLLQMDINYFIINCNIGEIYIVGTEDDRGNQDVKVIEIVSRAQGKIQYISLHSTPYLS